MRRDRCGEIAGDSKKQRVEDVGDGFAVAVLRHRLSLYAEKLAFERLDNRLAAGKELLQQRDVIGERKLHSISCSNAVLASLFQDRNSGTGESMFVRHCIVGAIFALSVSTPLAAQTTDVEFFETKIRPVLVQRCYRCHNSKMAAPKGDLVLDTKEGMLKGGTSGPALVPASRPTAGC